MTKLTASLQFPLFLKLLPFFANEIICKNDENQEFNTFEDGTQSMTRNNTTFPENKVQTLFLSLSILSTRKVSLNYII